MLDFVKIKEGHPKQGIRTIYPAFSTLKSKDLLVKGGKFYAVWNEDAELWSTDENDVIKMIDASLWNYYDEHKSFYPPGEIVQVLTLEDGDSKMIDKFKHNCEKQRSDSFVELDGKLIFSNMEVKRSDYASKRLPYPLEPGECPSYERIMSTLYSPVERHKIEWCIGSIVAGDSVKLQKFLVLYGEAGSGKSTVINIIQELFQGYYAAFDAKSLGSANSAFALEAFRDNPLVAIQHDGDLSKIEDNTRLNSLVSHESMLVNEKFMKQYGTSFRSFLIMGTNSPVKITNAKSGLIRRLIDATPSGNKLDEKEYWQMVNRIPFELGPIAWHCRDVYLANPNYYSNYIPTAMLGATNDFYNFMSEYYYQFKTEDCVSLKVAWERYNTYCESAQVYKKYSQIIFGEELKNYFREFKDRYRLPDGTRIRKYYMGFRAEKIDGEEEKEEEPAYVIQFESIPSIFDRIYQDCPAQYATAKGAPKKPWDEVSTKLSDLDTGKLHYVRPPENLICIDFDIKGPDGEKSYEENLQAASKWPPTYAELSKSGKAIHLYYIYTGDVTKLSALYDTDVEVKTFLGKAALRRLVTKCNSLAITVISSGLPLKEEKKVVTKEAIMTEKGLRTFVKRNLNKEYHADTRSSIDFINKVLNDMYESGKPYDISDMRSAVLMFAANSTNQAPYCMQLVNKMHFKSEEASENVETRGEPLIFFDCEVFPNLVLVCWKMEGEGRPVHRLFNPSPQEIEQILGWNLVGFNCRRYDNHILHALLLGWTPEQVFDLSQRIIGGDKNAFFGEAYNHSYTDIYDFSSKKQSLKKFEIELGISHLELGLPWDQPVDESLWDKVAEYCDNDVIATEAVFNARKADFLAREILADVAGMTVNDTTNSLTTRIIFGRNRNPQAAFNYRDMGDVNQVRKFSYIDTAFTKFDEKDRPIFPGYRYEFGTSTYRDEVVGEGGYVYSEPGMYNNVALLDIASMHPSSIIAEELFGPEYTARFKEIYDARIAIKHKDFDSAREMLGGKLAKYLTDEKSAKDLAGALKIAINSVYGLTSAKFDNPFRDIRNKDNIVAKRGALFMINLKHLVMEQGFTVAHIKTDSIKIPNATPEIIDFVMEYGKLYGYTFEHEATYEKMCLVNDAVYIAKYAEGGEGWTATGTQFQVPYVFKTLFSHEPIEFKDMCETKSVTSALYLDMNEGLPEGEHKYVFVGKVSSFCPMLPGSGGGELVREGGKDAEGNTKYSSATGAKGYRWLESGVVQSLGLEDQIDISYYRKQVDEAIEDINHYGDFYEFAN